MRRFVFAATLLSAGHGALGLTHISDTSLLQTEKTEPELTNVWMTAQELNTWGEGQQEEADKAQEAEAQKAMLEQAAAQASEAVEALVSSNLHKAQMQVNASSDLEGFSEPLNVSQIRNMSDKWVSVPDVAVTFSYGTHCDVRTGCRSSGSKRGQPSFQEMHRNVLASIRALRFCFNDVLIVLDSPHVGHDKAGPETQGNMSSHTILPIAGPSTDEMILASTNHLLSYDVSSELKAAATATAKSATDLLRDHCATAAPTWKVRVVDYSSVEMKNQAFEHYAISEEDRSSRFYDKMYMNTMALDQNFQANGRYVYHMDAQWRAYRSNFSHHTPNFIEKAVSLMSSDDRVYMASLINTFNNEPMHNTYNKFAVIPGAVHGSTAVERVKGMLKGWSSEQWLSAKRPLRGEAFSGKWSDGKDDENEKIALYTMNWDDWGGIVTRHQFLMDVQRFKSMFPLEEWDTAAEHMWSSNMNKKKPGQAFQVYFNETVGVFAGPSEI